MTDDTEVEGGDDQDEAGFLEDLEAFSKSPDPDEPAREEPPAESSMADLSAEEFEQLMNDPLRFETGVVGTEEEVEVDELPSWATESDEAWNARMAGFYAGDTAGVLE